MNDLIQRFEAKFMPIRALLFLLPLVPAWYLFIQKDMVFPPTDLSVYKRASEFLVSGQSPYSDAFTTEGFEILPWVYTPFASLLVLPMQYLSDVALFALWSIGAILVPLIFLVAVSYHAVLSHKRYTKGEKVALLVIFVLAGALVGSVLDTLILGQVGVLLAALALYDMAAPDSWLGRGRLRLPRGVLAGIAGAIKLIPLVVVPYWLITRQWKAAATTLGTVATAWGIAFLVFPKDSITYFFGLKFMESNNPDWVGMPDNQSLIAAIQRMVDIYPLPIYIWAPISAAIVLLGLLAARAAYRAGDALAAGLIVGLTSALASPVSWVHHYAWLVAVPGAILAGRSFRNASGSVSKAGWVWLGTVLLVAFPPTRYSWSPLRWIEWDEHYNLIAIALIAFFWIRARRRVHHE